MSDHWEPMDRLVDLLGDRLEGDLHIRRENGLWQVETTDVQGRVLDRRHGRLLRDALNALADALARPEVGS